MSQSTALSLHEQTDPPALDLADARRARIIAAATEAFLEHGYAGATTAMVARAARVSKRTVYDHFECKRDLLAAVIRMKQPLLIALPRPPEEDVPVLEGLSRIFLLDLPPEVQTERIRLLDLILREGLAYPDINAFLYESGVLRMKEPLEAWLERERARGKIAFDDADACATMLLDLVFGALQPRRRTTHPPGFERQRAEILMRLRVFLAGCAEVRLH